MSIHTCTLLLPVGPALTPDELIAVVDVLVRTAPDTVELDLVLAVEEASDTTRQLVAAMDGDVTVVDGSLPQAATRAGTGSSVAVVDPAVRPDLAVLPELLDRLHRADDPLPFVHRLGLLVCRAGSLAALGGETHSTSLPALARALRPVPAAPPAPTGTAGARPSRPGTVSIVLVAASPLPVLASCLFRLRRFSPGAELIVVDPGGDYQRSRELRTLSWVSLVSGTGPHPQDAGVRAATGEFVVLLDPGTWVTRRWLDGLLAPLRADAAQIGTGPRCNVALGAAAQPGVRYRDASEMEEFAETVRRSAGGSTTPVAALSGFCLALRRDALLAVGGHDPAIGHPDLATIDLCLRLRGASAGDGGFALADGVFVHVAELPRGLASGRWRAGGGDLDLLRARHGRDADRVLPGVVGAVMIVKDEEETIARALESVSGIVDDVVVCDTGSTDGTGDLLDALGVRREFFAWRHDFGAARNAALAGHNGVWGLLLDADETLVCAEPARWRRELAENGADVVILLCHNLDSGTGGAAVDNASARLLRARDCHWSGRIHEQMVRRDGAPVQQGASDLAKIVHDGYSLRKIVDRDKVARNSTLTELSLTSPADNERIPGRTVFEHGRTEFLHGDFEAAERCFRAALAELPDRAENLRRMALCNLAMIASDRGELEQAAELAEQALGGEYTYTQAAHVLAVARLRAGGTSARAEARQILERALAAGRASEDASVTRLVLSLRDEGLLLGDMPMLLGGLLLEADEAAAAVDLLLPLARDRAEMFGGWSVLAAALRQVGDDWPDRLVELAAPVPGVLEPVLAKLTGDDRSALVAAMDRRGIAEWEAGPTDRLWRVLQPDLRRMSRAGVVAAARHHESESPELALRLWRYAGDDPQARVGQARCLDALGRAPEAAQAIAGVHPDDLDPGDLLFVTALAADLGDLDLARELLATLPDELDPQLQIPAQRMREVLAPAEG